MHDILYTSIHNSCVLVSVPVSSPLQPARCTCNLILAPLLALTTMPHTYLPPEQRPEVSCQAAALAASVHTVERAGRAARARDFCHLPRTCNVCHLEVRQTDSVVLRIHSDTSAGRWSLWGHRMRSCQYRATRLASVHASVTAWKWTGNK